jgi:hypothetical protein
MATNLTLMPVFANSSTELDKHKETEFSAALLPLTSICRPPLTADQVRGYYAALGDIPAKALALAAQQLAATRKYPTFPMPGEIREVAAQITQGAGPTVGEAWSLSIAAVRKFGLRGSERGLASLPPAVAEALRYFGWERLCNTFDCDLGTAFAQFRDCFSPVAAREERMKALPSWYKEVLANIGHSIEEKPICPHRAIGNQDRGSVVREPINPGGPSHDYRLSRRLSRCRAEQTS